MEDATPWDKIYIPVPLEEWLRTADDFYICESITMIKLKRPWNINGATIALRDACEKEWHRRYGNKIIPEVEISEEAKELLKSES